MKVTWLSGAIWICCTAIASFRSLAHINVTSAHRCPVGGDYAISSLCYLQTGSVAVTFFCAKVHFHSGVSPGVQDLPGNDADDRHPERRQKGEEAITVLLFSCVSKRWQTSEDEVKRIYFYSKHHRRRWNGENQRQSKNTMQLLHCFWKQKELQHKRRKREKWIMHQFHPGWNLICSGCTVHISNLIPQADSCATRSWTHQEVMQHQIL